VKYPRLSDSRRHQVSAITPRPPNQIISAPPLRTNTDVCDRAVILGASSTAGEGFAQRILNVCSNAGWALMPRLHVRGGPFFEIGPFDPSFLTLSRNAVFRSVGRPCFFNKSLNASSASSWKSIMRSRASRSSSCHVQSSNWIRFPAFIRLAVGLPNFCFRSVVLSAKSKTRCDGRGWLVSSRRFAS
jgi:hypothetical protein